MSLILHSCVLIFSTYIIAYRCVGTLNGKLALHELLCVSKYTWSFVHDILSRIIKQSIKNQQHWYVYIFVSPLSSPYQILLHLFQRVFKHRIQWDSSRDFAASEVAENTLAWILTSIDHLGREHGDNNENDLIDAYDHLASRSVNVTGSLNIGRKQV